MPIVDLTGHPEISATFHYPCHDCGQSIEVVDATRQPHECRTYETDAERICAAYWAGYERAKAATTELISAANDALRAGPFRVVDVEQSFKALDAARDAGWEHGRAEALTEAARSYFRDAEQLAAMEPQEIAGLSTDQWAVVYRTVADELRKCATTSHGAPERRETPEANHE